MNNLHKTNLILLFSIILLIFTFLVSGGAGRVGASAETEATLAYDGTDVLDDLAGMTIDGVKFSASNYPANSSGSLRLLAFVEYGYNFYEDRQDNYGLYVYVYNPAKTAISAASTLNYIQLRAGGDAGTSYKRYSLKFLSVSEGSGINGLYYKYKLTLTDSQKETVLSLLDSSSRVYEIGEIELLTIDDVNATAYEIASTYTYAGYASGYGADTSAASTLTCTTAEDVETISLSVNHTTYRPDGNNGTDVYTQDSLHSVYFSVPDEYIANYGEMTEVHATWRDAVLNPVLVTGNSDAAAAIEEYLGVDIGEGVEDLNYAYATNLGASHASYDVYNADYSFNLYDRDEYRVLVSTDNVISALYMLFEVEDADTAHIDSETLVSKMLEMTKQYGGTKVNGKYSSCLFESVADEFTEVKISADDEYTLTQITVAQNNWWNYFITGNKYTETSSTTFKGIKAIYEVTDSDFTGTDEENAANLYVNEGDYDDFKTYYEEAKENGETVYLFRYQESDYIAAEATLLEWTERWWTHDYWNEVDTNAYFAQETVNLDFDIIDLKFTQGEVNTVIAVVMSPIDVISEITPPLITTPDLSDFWKYGAAIISGLAAIFVLYYVTQNNASKQGVK